VDRGKDRRERREVQATGELKSPPLIFFYLFRLGVLYPAGSPAVNKFLEFHASESDSVPCALHDKQIIFLIKIINVLNM
jgi:hypothetical protein